MKLPYSIVNDKTLTVYLKAIGKFTLLSQEQVNLLARRVRKGDEQARKQLVNSNLQLVISIAKRYS